MELIRITGGKIKVMLTANDVARLRFYPEQENGAYLGDSFRALLAEIQEEVGFESDGKELSIQYFPSREGGCEMFISHMNDNPSPGSILPEEITEFHREFAFCFGDMEDLLLACKRLTAAGYIGESQAFIDQKRNCFLFLALLSRHPFDMPEELLFLSEYGRQTCVGETKIYLSEHGAPICSSGAVEKLASLA